MLFDCGRSDDSGIRPSEYLPSQGINTIHRLIITNYDQDHIADLPNLRKKTQISRLWRNRSIDAGALKRLKQRSGPISEAMECLLGIITTWVDATGPPPAFPDVTWSLYRNNYPTDFEDTNNLSLVSFLTCRRYTFVIPGDLEKAGWEKLLQRQDFRNDLYGVDVFVASHHGRENGYCKQVFDYIARGKPDVIIMSDGPKLHATQEMVNTYAQHVGGVQFNGRTRYVLTTRNDGSLSWNNL